MPQTVPIRPDGLQIDENRPFQERFWVLQRIGWTVYALIILFALAGLTGRDGIAAQGETRIAKAEITWPRITRRGTLDTLTIRLTGDIAPELTLAPAFTDAFQIETIQPRPAMESGANPLRFAFFPDRPAPYTVTFHLRALSAGLTRYTLGIGDENITLTTLTLP